MWYISALTLNFLYFVDQAWPFPEGSGVLCRCIYPSLKDNASLNQTTILNPEIKRIVFHFPNSYCWISSRSFLFVTYLAPNTIFIADQLPSSHTALRLPFLPAALEKAMPRSGLEMHTKGREQKVSE